MFVPFLSAEVGIWAFGLLCWIPAFAGMPMDDDQRRLEKTNPIYPKSLFYSYLASVYRIFLYGIGLKQHGYGRRKKIEQEFHYV